MHPSLYTEELQALIFSSLNRHDCSQVAQVCTSFYNQGMNLVWAEVHSFMPFILCLSPDALTRDAANLLFWANRRARYLVSVGFCRELQLADWHKFCKHLNRVRKFTDADKLCVLRHHPEYPDEYEESVYELTPSALKVVSRFIFERSQRGGLGMFAHLTSLHIYSGRNITWFPKYITHLCSDALDSLSLEFSDSVHTEYDGDIFTHVKEILPSLRSVWPRLRSIKLDTAYVTAESPVEALRDCVESLVQDNPCLESFTVSVQLHPWLIHSLASLALLRSLDMTGTSPAVHLTEPLHLFPSCFTSLTHLSLSWYEPGTVLPLLEALQGSNTLTNLYLYLTPRLNPESVLATPVQAVLHALSRIQPIASLDILLREWTEDNAPFPVLTSEGFSSLLALRQLRRIAIRGFTDITINDEDLKAASTAWHMLETITIQRANGVDSFVRERTPSTSLVGVQALYNGCPNLRGIVLEVNGDLGPGTFSDNLSSLPKPTLRTNDLETLELMFKAVGGEGFQDTSEAAMPAAVRLLFPQLKTLISYIHEKDGPRAREIEVRWEAYRNMDLEAMIHATQERLQELHALDSDALGSSTIVLPESWEDLVWDVRGTD